MKHRFPLTTMTAIGMTVWPLLTGCGSSGLPTAPTSSSSAPPVALPTPRYAEGDRWNLQATYRGHTGPEACLPPFDGKPRPPTDYVLIVQRYGASIHLVTEHDHYVGTVVGDQFLASESDEIGSTWECGGVKVRFRTEGQVSGSLSADGRFLTGEEVAVFLLESGETIRRHWDWTATRQ